MAAGNGPASGSGNLFRESFTSVLEEAARPIFQAANITFETRNYAIQALSSGDEVALCSAELYGKEYDIMFWDFDMTDEQDFWKLAMFASRTMTFAGKSTGAPALIAFQRTKGHASVLVRLEQAGLAVLGRDTMVQQQQNMACPDSTQLSKNEREALPPHLRYIRCGKEMEEGGPKTYDGVVDGKKMCRAHKFNNDVCPARPRKYIWHPGWRVNAIKGYTLALTLMELLLDALEGLELSFQIAQQDGNTTTMTIIQNQMEELEYIDQTEYTRFWASKRTDLLHTHWLKQEEQTHNNQIDLESLFRLPALCRTALLPSKSRMLQTEDIHNFSMVKLVNNPYNETVESGVLMNQLRSFESNKENDGGYHFADVDRHSDIVIITDKVDYLDESTTCSEQLAINHQDAFIVTSAQGWRSMTLPSDVELRYNDHFDVSAAKGWMFMCLFICNDSKCPPQDLHDHIYKKPTKDGRKSSLQGLGNFEMTINGVRVTNYEVLIKNRFSHLDNCLALGHDVALNDGKKNETNSEYVWRANANGEYVVMARISNATQWSYIKVSSIVLM